MAERSKEISKERTLNGRSPKEMKVLRVRNFVQRRTFLNIPKLTNQNRGSYDQEYHIHKKMNHPQELVYDIIQDVARYHEFIPYCTRSFIDLYDPTTKTPSKGGFRVGFQNFDEEFTCDLTCTPYEQVIVSICTKYG